MTRARRSFALSSAPRDDGTARHGSRGRGRRLAPAASARSRAALKRPAGRARARLNFTNRRLAVDWRDGSARSRARSSTRWRGSAIAPIRSRPDAAEDEEARQARWLLRCLAVAGFAAMNIMLLSVSVWAGNASDMTPETRDFFHWLSALIALPAAAYAGQPFFRSAWRALRARQRQHGRADLARRRPRARHVGGRDRSTTPQHAYFDSADHAAVLPAVRPLSRSRDAAQDARGRRQSRRAARPRSHIASTRTASVVDRAGRRPAAGRPRAGAAGRARAGRRRRPVGGARRSTRASSPAKPRAVRSRRRRRLRRQRSISPAR